MKRYQEFLDRNLDESSVRRGAVALYAATSKRHGDLAVSSYQRAKFELKRAEKAQSVDEKIEYLTDAIILIVDGLIATRQQIGAVSAQITSHSLLTSSSS